MIGELVYLSERKLRNAAGELGIGANRFSKGMAVEGTARFSLPVPPIVKLTAQATGHAELPESASPERETGRLLARVIRALERDGVPDLVADAGEIREGDWFRFHRSLRFGVGQSDSNASVRALILVDREPVEEQGATPGLLMHGAPNHALVPYRDDDLADGREARSGSGSGTLFAWAQRVSAAVEDLAATDLDELETAVFASRPRREEESVLDMYRLFTREDWMARIPQLANAAPCEGIARATCIATAGASTVVMASPLYVRILALPADAQADAQAPDPTLPRTPRARRFGRRRPDKP